MSQLPSKPSAAVYLPAPTSFEEAYRIAKVLAASDLVPKDYRDKPENCLVAMQWGADVGLPGLQALQNIAVINGRPSIWGDAAKALVLNANDCEDIEEYLEGEGDNMVAVCIVKRRNRKPVEVRFSVADAKKASLWGKAGPWQNYPKRMLQMRARGFALRDSFPDALRGLSIAEESQDIPEKDMGHADVVTETKPTVNMPKPKTEPAKTEEKPAAAPKSDKKANTTTTNAGAVIDNDTGEVLNKEPNAENKQEPAANQTAPGKASVGMLTFIRKKAAEKEIPEEVICAEHDIENLEGIDEAKGNDIINWIKAQ